MASVAFIAVLLLPLPPLVWMCRIWTGDWEVQRMCSVESQPNWCSMPKLDEWNANERNSTDCFRSMSWFSICIEFRMWSHYVCDYVYVSLLHHLLVQASGVRITSSTELVLDISRTTHDFIYLGIWNDILDFRFLPNVWQIWFHCFFLCQCPWHFRWAITKATALDTFR